MACHHYVGHHRDSGVAKSGITQKPHGGHGRIEAYIKDNPAQTHRSGDWNVTHLEIDADTLSEARRAEDRHHRLLRFGEALAGDRRHPADEAFYVDDRFARASAMAVFGSHNMGKAVARTLGLTGKRGAAPCDAALDVLEMA